MCQICVRLKYTVSLREALACASQSDPRQAFVLVYIVAVFSLSHVFFYVTVIFYYLNDLIEYYVSCYVTLGTKLTYNL